MCNLCDKTQIFVITKAIIYGQKIDPEPCRNIDMLKSYGGNNMVQRCVLKQAQNKRSEETH